MKGISKVELHFEKVALGLLAVAIGSLLVLDFSQPHLDQDGQRLECFSPNSQFTFERESNQVEGLAGFHGEPLEFE